MKSLENKLQKEAQKKAQKCLKTPVEESHNGSVADENLIALVKLLARIEAEKDFRLYLESIQPLKK